MTALRSTSSADPLAVVRGLVGDLGVSGPVPAWTIRLLSAEAEAVIAERWDPVSEIWSWHDTDGVIATARATNRTVDLADLAPLVRLEFLANFASDWLNGNKASPSAARSIARDALLGEVDSLRHLDQTALAQLPALLWRRWEARVEVATADPEREWDRDDVRLTVVRPGSPGTVLRVGLIAQPWLRALLITVLKVRMHEVTEATMQRYVVAFARLSSYLSTRVDRGLNPSALSSAAMDRFAASLQADPKLTVGMASTTLKDLRAILIPAQAMGYCDKYGLPAAFNVRPGHMPEEKEVVRPDRAFPDATFRLLTGVDEVFGSAVFDLARTVLHDGTNGDLFVTALLLGANFGRRPQELLALRADRLRFRDNGEAEIIYDNFKSGRDRVWLPIDARSAEITKRWIDTVRALHPTTPLSEVALFPRFQRNPRGSQPMDTMLLSRWFRNWTHYLEQAILIGHLCTATGVAVSDLLRLTLGDVSGPRLTVAGVEYELPQQVLHDLVDYAAEVRTRMQRSQYGSNLSAAPLFPDPALSAGRRGSKGTKKVTWAPTKPERFDALGDGWIEKATRYPCAGIPGRGLGQSRISAGDLQVRLFRHTYLQHLVNLGTDIFLVQELADHANVQTTINSYVSVQDEKLREAVDMLAQHRLVRYGDPARGTLPLSVTANQDVGTNDCVNPKVIDRGREGCDRDRMCFGCDFLTADPSHIPDIKAEIQTCNASLARLEAAEESPLTPHHRVMLRARRDGWQDLLKDLQQVLDNLDVAQREQVLTAANIVRDFRDRMRAGGINLNGRTLG